MSPDSNQRWLSIFFLVILFAVSYGIVWILGASVFEAFVSPMHVLIPIVGFFLAFWGFEWVQHFFDVKLSSLWFLVLLVLLSLLAFYVSAWFYYCNGFTDITAVNATCDQAGSQRAIQYINTNFTNLLTKDAFFYFALAVLLGWVSRVIWRHALSHDPTDAKQKKKK